MSPKNQPQEQTWSSRFLVPAKPASRCEVPGLGRPLSAFRIGDTDGAYDIFSGEGSRLNLGRWHKTGQPMMYASEHYSTAMLEKLVRLGEMPPNQRYVEISIPAGTRYEVVTKDSLPGWHEQNCAVSQDFGARWFQESRSAILIVPSVVARMERNILIHPGHTDFKAISVGEETPIWWDERLFESNE